MNWRVTFTIAKIFIGCMLNMVFLELLVKRQPDIGTLVMFLQFLFISTYGFIFGTKCGQTERIIGFYDYTLLVAMFFISNICNNLAFNYNIPVPLHMIFSSGSLVTNMILGILILNKKYTLTKYVSVFMITLGIFICTIMTKTKKLHCVDCNTSISTSNTDDYDNLRLTIGITLMTVALFTSARMGLYQEWLYGHYGKHPKEALFYTHALPLPAFAFFYTDIYKHIDIAVKSEGYTIPYTNIAIPIVCLYLLGNVLSQFLCISSVYVLSTECTSLTVTLVVTLRKFLSLLFSIMYFKNPFTLMHWVGTVLVFGGTFLFVEIVQMFRKQSVEEDEMKMVCVSSEEDCDVEDSFVNKC